MMLKKFFQTYFLDDLKALILILLGTLTWSLTMVKSGIAYSYRMGFWGPNGHDGIWHIALAGSLAKGSWEMPIFAGETIKNYHIGFDLLLAIIHKLTFIPIHNLYFQIFPPITAFFIGIFSYKFVYFWRRSKLQAFWATFFVYFGGSFGWILTLLRDGKLGGESVFWSQQSISTLINPPYAFSVLLIFIGLNVLVKGFHHPRSRQVTPRRWLFRPLRGEKNSDKSMIIATFIFGILVQIKVYAGILSLAGLLLAGVWQMFKRKGVTLMKVASGSLIISILIFSPLTGSVGESIIFRPFWFLEGMMGFQDRLNWPKFAEAMLNYKLGGIWLRGLTAYSLTFAIFIIGNFGTRVISLFWFSRKVRNLPKIDFVDIFIISTIFLGIIVPLFFIQSGNSWNTIQFLYYSLAFSGVLAGVVLGEYFENKSVSLFYNSRIKAGVVLIVVLLTIPTTMSTLAYHYLPSRPPAMISKEELEALKFLEKQPDGIVLTSPFDKAKADATIDNPPRPLYLYESTAYVSAFSGKTVYLEDEGNLEITGYPWRQRRVIAENFYLTLDQAEARNFLEKNDISYIYWIRGQGSKPAGIQPGIEKIFENKEVEIYKIY